MMLNHWLNSHRIFKQLAKALVKLRINEGLDGGGGLVFIIH